ncbi:MAG: GtrA family protein [Candidatus Paceibacterota bacterium]
MKNTYATLDEKHAKKMKIARYVISGGTAAVTDLAFLYLFTDILHIWYLVSTVFAFIIAFCVSFTLQKYWTFRDHSSDGVGAQGALYFTVSVINLAVNTGLMYLLTDIFGSHYMISQIIAAGCIAIVSFFVYQKLIFKQSLVS